MDIENILKRSIKISKRRFVLLALLVSLIGSVGLAAYTFANMGDEYAKNRSTTIMGQPQYLHPIMGKDTSALSKPLSAAISGKYVYVADSAHGKLAVFNKRGSFVLSAELLKGINSYPLGITVGDRNRIYITVETRGFFHIMVVDRKGKFQYLFPKSDLENGKKRQPILNHPVGLFHQDGKIYVTDVGDHDVKIFSTDGKLLGRFGRPGSKNGEFMFPHGITADDEGNVYVADSNNSRVEVFDSKGKFKYLFKPRQKEPLVIPRGIAIDSLGRVHVVDLARQKVMVFTKNGKYLLSYGANLGQQSLSYPNGIAIDKDSGLIYIADRQNNRIAVFSE